MKRKIGTIYNKPIIEGDINLKGPNEIHKSELCGSNSEEGGGNSEEEHWIGIQFGNADMGINPIPLCPINWTELGREIGCLHINKGIGVIAEGNTSGNGYSAFGGLLTYGDIISSYDSYHSIDGYNYYELVCVNIKQQERIIYKNSNGAVQDTPICPNYNFGAYGKYTLQDIENKILESKLFSNHSKSERIVAIMSVIGFLIMRTKCDEWYGDIPIDEYLTNAGVDMFTTLEIVYPNKDEMLNIVKDTIINFKG